MVALDDKAGTAAAPAQPAGLTAWRALEVLRGLGHTLALRMSRLAPTGLYARALLIIITPIVLLEGVVAFSFMERHWQAVTRRLSEATARDIAALIDVYE